MTSFSAPPAPPAPPRPPLLTVRDLSVRVGALELVHAVSFELGAGERVGIIGASGSGKTLTCMAIAGLLPPELTATGSVRLADFDHELVGAPERVLARARGRLTGMVFQEPMTALNPTMRVDRQIGEALRVHKGPDKRADRASIAAAVTELLTSVGFDEPDRISRSFPHQLSGGQRQRVVIAIALANNPGLIICDEPTTALDVSVQAQVLDLIDARVRALGSAVLFISHDLAVVASVCDQLLVMHGGRIVERGPVPVVLTRPRHEHTRRLLADSQLDTPVGAAADADAPGENGRGWP